MAFKRMGMLLAVLASITFAGLQENYNGYGDTAVVQEFNADSMDYTKAFKLSAFENLRVTLAVDDTSSAGFASDSVFAYWGIQTGHPIYDSDGDRDTLWNPLMIVIDTLDLIQNPTVGLSYSLLSIADGSYSEVQTLVDTLSLSGYAAQTRNISPAWDVLFRCWVKGGTGNKVGSFIKTMFTVLQRNYQKTN